MEDEFGIFKSVFGLQRMFFEAVRSQMEDADVHPRQGPILNLLLHRHAVSQADLMREMKVSAATVAVSLARLEKLGYVARERNQQNQRANVLTLTPEGRRKAESMHKLMHDIGLNALRDFTDEEKEVLRALCQRMEENLRIHYKIKECEGHHASNG